MLLAMTGPARPPAAAPRPDQVVAAEAVDNVASGTDASRTAPPPDGPVVYLDDLPPEAVEIAAVGDVNLGGRVGEVIEGQGPEFPWRGVGHLLQRADLTVINLECTISRRGTALPKQFAFRGDPGALPAMRAAGVDVASLANNHSLDYGREAFLDTLEHLRRTGIHAAGGGRNAEEAWEPLVLTRRDVRFGFVAATRVLPAGFGAGPRTPGVASAYDERRFVEAVEQARAMSDVVVVLVHWGVELATQPNDIQERLARTLVDAGADIIIGHHPHVLQPVVRYRGAVIAYSLGNFVFSSGSPAGNDSMILRIGVMPDRSMVVAKVPIRIVGTAPQPVSEIGGSAAGVVR